MPTRLITDTTAATPIRILDKEGLEMWQQEQPESVKRWIAAHQFEAAAGKTLSIPDDQGNLSQVLHGAEFPLTLWSAADLPYALPKSVYRFDNPQTSDDGFMLALGWLLGSYRYTRYMSDTAEPSQLLVPNNIDTARLHHMANAITLCRDMIHCPAADMLPSDMEAIAREMAARFDASINTIEGESLLSQGYEAIYTVGKASACPPRLIDLRWGDPSHPKVTLVGKGVCFDSGGLDIKPSGNMALMRKDMGGAAITIGLAQLIMASALPVRLRLLVPSVENAISGNAFRTGDIIRGRNGKTIEVGNTDAEGRLILSDALVEACSESPEILIDAATLTGAARVALGAEVPAIFSNDDQLATEAIQSGRKVTDPLWQLPLWQPYRSQLNSKYADICSISKSPFGGAITAALFLQEFVTCPSWIHMDVMAWNTRALPGRPLGGEAMGLRALYELIESRYAS